MKKSLRKLALRKETVRALSTKDLERAVGGFAADDSGDRQCPALAEPDSRDRQCPALAALVQGG